MAYLAKYIHCRVFFDILSFTDIHTMRWTNKFYSRSWSPLASNMMRYENYFDCWPSEEIDVLVVVVINNWAVVETVPWGFVEIGRGDFLGNWFVCQQYEEAVKFNSWPAVSLHVYTKLSQTFSVTVCNQHLWKWKQNLF